jgi:hypothetical protein
MLNITNILSSLPILGGAIHNTTQEKYLKEILGSSSGY